MHTHPELDIRHPADGTTRITLRGDLDADRAAAIWDDVLDAAQRADQHFTIDLAGVNTSDGVGLALLVAAQRAAASNDTDTTFENANNELAELLRMAQLPDASHAAAPPTVGPVSQIGQASAAIISATRSLIAFIGVVAAGVLPQRALHVTHRRRAAAVLDPLDQPPALARFVVFVDRLACVQQIVVTNAAEKTGELRALIPTRNSGDQWDLRCKVRKAHVRHLRDDQPEALPKHRADIGPPLERSASAADA